MPKEAKKPQLYYYDMNPVVNKNYRKTTEEVHKEFKALSDLDFRQSDKEFEDETQIISADTINQLRKKIPAVG